VSGTADDLPRSRDLYERALHLLPGGVNSPVRAMRSIGRDPIFIASGEGARIRDVDGREYVDWVGSWGPLILGHADPGVVTAVRDAAGRGTSFGAPTEGEVALAAEVVARVPSVEMVRMTSSGTEASMSAIRLARAATGREQILKFAGAYHGHVDGLLAQAGSGLATQGIPASPGVTAAATASTSIVAWNDLAAVRAACQAVPPAAIIAEPVPANMGVVPPEPGFLAALRELADTYGALLIFDEVITGFRVSRGGAQELYEVAPDLSVLGKIVGGGLPAAAYGGRRELMEQIAPAGEVYQAGTLSGNPLAVAAALATLARLDAAAYARLEELTAQLADGLAGAAEAHGVPLTLQRVPGLLTPFFLDRPVRSYADAAACDLEAYGAWCRGLLARGVYPPASQFEAWFPSLAHTEADIADTVRAADEAFAEVVARVPETVRGSAS
jgi:glutamate-1-semialdehyde 2,1-aminomutase